MKNLMKAILISGSIATLANLAGAAAAEPQRSGQKVELPGNKCGAGQGQTEFPEAVVNKGTDASSGGQTQPDTKSETAKTK